MNKEQRIELGSYIAVSGSLVPTSKLKAAWADFEWVLKSNIPKVAISLIRNSGFRIDRGYLTLFDNTQSFIHQILDVGERVTESTYNTSASFNQKFLKTAAGLGVYHPAYEQICSYINNSRFDYKILLYGPPGTGKTSLSRILDGFENVVFVKSLRELSLATPDKTYVIDDIDLLVPNLREGGSKEKEGLRTILAFLDKARRVVITTNTIDTLDPALLREGRLDLRVFVGYLSEEDIRKIVCIKLMASLGRRRQPDGSPVYEKFTELVADWVISKMKPEEDGLYSPCKINKVYKKCLDTCRKMFVETQMGEDREVYDIIEVYADTFNVEHSKINKLLGYANSKLDSYDCFIRNYLWELVSQPDEEINEEEDDEDGRSGIFPTPKKPKRKGN